MITRNGFAASHRRLVAVVALVGVGILFAGVPSHAHTAPRADDCAICKAASSVVTLEASVAVACRPELPRAHVVPAPRVVSVLVLGLDRPGRAPPAC